MTNTNITNFRKNIFEYMNQAIEYNDIINVNTKSGNAVIMSEEEYNGMIETLYLSSVPGLKADILACENEPIDGMVDADSLEW